VTPDIVASVRFLLDQIVTGVPGVTGALVSTVDGFAVADRIVLPPRASGGTPTDAQGLAAMSAALIGVANRMLAALGDQPTAELTAGSESGNVVLCRIGTTAVLTVITGPTARVDDVEVVAREVAAGIHRLVTEARPRPAEPAPATPTPPPAGTAHATAKSATSAPWSAPSQPPAAAPAPPVGAR
jgi:predicted regulator of Ras-like GTPase activity (Roadblock/LC7/MglB family)